MLTKQHILYASGACLLLLMAGLGLYNVVAYLKAGLLIFAIVAAASELIGFVMAVVVEFAIRERRYWAAGVCGGILAACATFNVVGAEHAYRADQVYTQDQARRAAQESLDTQRTSLQTDIASAEAEVRRFDHLLPDASVNSWRAREMRAAWELATEDARSNKRRAQESLDTLPVVAEAPPQAHAYDPLAVQLGFGIAEVIKVLGLWACGFGALATGQRSGATSGNETNRPTTEATLRGATKATLQETVQRLRSLEKPLSYGAISRLTGVNKGTLWKLVNQDGASSPA